MTEWERDNNPIDKRLQSCLNEHPDTAGQIQCEASAYRAWDQELNSVYKQLRAQVDPATGDALKQDQQNWLKFRDTELKFISDIYNSKQGTMFAPMQADAETELVKDRALQLHHRLDVLNIDSSSASARPSAGAAEYAQAVDNMPHVISEDGGNSIDMGAVFPFLRGK